MFPDDEKVKVNVKAKENLIPISRMAGAVQPSATLAAGAKARLLKANGVHVFDFSLGEPDFPTPEFICQAATKAMQMGHTHYTPVAGISDLRIAISNFYQKTYGLICSSQQVIVSNGAKHSIHNALAATVGPGDEVIIPTPFWVSYQDLVSMTGANSVLVPTTFESGFKMTASQLRAAITPRSRLLILNSPNNPTGTVYTADELKALAKVILESNVAVLSDEIYERLVYDNAKASCFASLHPDLPSRTITVSGVSKSYAMTGWRIGWAVAPLPVGKAMETVQSQQTSNPCSISQYAALAALNGDQNCVEIMRKEFDSRRKLVCQRLAAIPGVRFKEPRGAFYVFFDVSSYFGKTLGEQKVTDSATFCQAALETAHVNLVPGSAFGAERFVRLSFAISREQINDGMSRLAQWLSS